MKLIVGLGNPTKQYDKTKHNLGFIIIDAYCKENNLKLKVENKFNSLVGIFSNGSETYILCKPLTYMNLSGNAVRSLVSYYKINIEDILIILDDVNLDFGQIRLRENGSAGGHNGLKNIIENLNTDNFKRLRFGVGRNRDIILRDEVLNNLSKKELELINEKTNITNNIIDDFLNDVGFDKIMNTYNKNE